MTSDISHIWQHLHDVLQGISRRPFLLVGLLLLADLSRSQDFQFKHLTMEDGLSDNQIFDGMTDVRGFLYLSTFQGLNRYDGREVELVKWNAYPEFVNRQFYDLERDGLGHVYVVSGSEMFRIDSFGRVSCVTPPDNLLGKIHAIRPFDQQSLVVYATKGWFHYDTRTQQWQFLSHLSDLSHGSTLTDLIVENTQFLYCIRRRSEIVKVNLISGEVVYTIPGNRLDALELLDDHRLVAATHGGRIMVFNSCSGKQLACFESVRHLDDLIIHNPVNDISRFDSTHILYLTEDDGMHMLNLSTGRDVVYLQDNLASSAIASNQTLKIIENGTGTFYVTFLYHGLDYFAPERYFIRQKTTFQCEDHETFKSYINSIACDSTGMIWMGATDRVIEYDAQAETCRFHYHYDAHEGVTNGEKYLLGYRAMGVDSRQRIWQGTFLGGIIVTDPKTGKSIRFNNRGDHDYCPIPSSYIWHIEAGPDGWMWIAHNRGFMRIDPLTFQVDTFPPVSVLSTLPRVRGKYIHHDECGRIWFGTHTSGLYGYSPEADSLIHFDRYKGFGEHCYNITSDSSGRVFVAHELGFTMIEEDTVLHYNTSNGLRHRPVEGFLMHEGYLYVANHSAILRFDPAGRTFKYFDGHFGFGQISFRANAMCQLPNGDMMWGTEQGFIQFSPERLNAAPGVDNVIIDKVYTGTGVHFYESDVRIDEDEALTFEFSTIDLFGVDNISYRYKLTGFQNDWIDIGTLNQVTFSALPSGEYSFMVQASSNGIDWVSNNDAERITVVKPLYRNPWVYAGIGGLLLFASGLYFFQHQKTRFREVRMKEKLAEMELKALRAQMNPHFVFNALNSIQYFTYSGDVDKANEYLSDFSRLLRLVLQQSKDGWTTMEEELTVIQLYLKLESLRFDHEFTYSIEVDEDIVSRSHIMMPAMVIQPVVENAIKHGLMPKQGEKWLHIHVCEDDDDIMVTVEDNGVGLHVSKSQVEKSQQHLRHDSMGLELIQRRLSLLPNQKHRTASMDVVEKLFPAQGTFVTIRFRAQNKQEL